MESSITLQFTRSKTLLKMRNLDTMKTLACFLLMLLLTPSESMPEIFQFPTLQYQLYIGKLVTVFQLLTTQKDRMFFVSAPHMKFSYSIGLSWYQSTSSYRCHDMSYHLKEIPWPLKSESLIEIIFSAGRRLIYIWGESYWSLVILSGMGRRHVLLWPILFLNHGMSINP